ncbi:MAG: hypothetical protein ACR2H1_11815, partial [Limisphaerales bacterium]
MGYATSFDGLKWTKPDLSVCRVGDKPALNCIVPDRNADGTGSFVRDPRPETPSHRRYMGVKFTYDGECASFSADGIVWRNYASNPVWRVPADAIHLMWDERRLKFVGFYKVWELIGKEVKPGGPAEGIPFIAHMPTFTPKDLGNGTTEFEGPRITFRAPEAAIVETRKFVLRSDKQGADDGGGTS